MNYKISEEEKCLKFDIWSIKIVEINDLKSNLIYEIINSK